MKKQLWTCIFIRWKPYLKFHKWNTIIVWSQNTNAHQNSLKVMRNYKNLLSNAQLTVSGSQLKKASCPCCWRRRTFWPCARTSAVCRGRWQSPRTQGTPPASRRRRRQGSCARTSPAWKGLRRIFGRRRARREIRCTDVCCCSLKPSSTSASTRTWPGGWRRSSSAGTEATRPNPRRLQNRHAWRKNKFQLFKLQIPLNKHILYDI